jgi:hypothetical protein
MANLKCITSLFFIMNFTCLADAPFISIEQRNADAEVILSGKIVSFESIKFPNELHPRKVAIVKVEDTEKGQINSEFALITVGYYWPNNLVSSQDLSFNLQDRGKWLLNKDETGLFVLNNPNNFIAVAK